jgi:hypothetical protein
VTENTTSRESGGAGGATKPNFPYVRPRFDSITLRKQVGEWWKGRLAKVFKTDGLIRQHPEYTSLPTRPADDDWLLFEPIDMMDPRKLEIDLMAPRRGADDGAKGYPPYDQNFYDTFHADLLQEFEKNHRDQINRRSRVFGWLTSELSSIEIFDPEPRLLDIEEKLISVNLPHLFERSSLELIDIERKLWNSEREYNHFKLINGLSHDAKDRRFGSTIAIFFAAIVFEYLLNKEMFVDDPVGIVYAVFLSLFNTVVPFFIGMSFGREIERRIPRDAHNYNYFRRPWSSIASYFGIAFSFTGILFLNAAAATVRSSSFESGKTLSEAELGVDSAQNEIANQIDKLDLIKNPFSETSWLSDPLSVVLVIVGLSIALLSFFDGRQWFEDKYPGFTSKRRQYDSARRSRSKAHEKLRREAASLVDDSAALIEKTFSDAEGRFLYFQRRWSEYNSLKRAHEFEYERLISVINAVANTYRQENIKSRGSIPPPLYFSQPVELPKISYMQLDTIDDAYLFLKSKFDVAASKVAEHQKRLTDKEREMWQWLKSNLEKVEGVAKKEVNESVSSLRNID